MHSAGTIIAGGREEFFEDMAILEVCTGSLQSVINAVEGGAQRIELCSALALDGLTPSVGLVRLVRERFPQLKIHVLIRPREGDFVYSHSELRQMAYDISAVLPYADGIVLGALTHQGDIDLMAMRALMAATEGKPVTFHRAFDVCRQPLVALEQVIQLGCKRLLSSGQAPTALQGTDMLRRLVDLAHERLIIMPGGGVGPANVHQILQLTAATEIHGSCSAGQGVTSTDIVRQTLAAL